MSKANNVTIQSPSVFVDAMYVRKIKNTLRLDEEAAIEYKDIFETQDVSRFEMDSNSKLSNTCDDASDANGYGTRRCWIQTNKSFLMKQRSSITAEFEDFKIQCDSYGGKVDIRGDITIKQLCLFRIISYNLDIAASATLTSELASIHADKTKKLKEKTPKKQAFTKHDFEEGTSQILNDVTEDHHLHLFATNNTTLSGRIQALNGLVIIDSMNHIAMTQNGYIKARDTLIRCANTITIEGSIITDLGSCFIGANGKFCVTQHGTIDVIILNMYGSPKEIDERATITAENMTLAAIARKIEISEKKIATFKKERKRKLFLLTKERDQAKKRLDAEIKNMNATIEKTGLDPENIVPFLQSMNKLPAITVQQQAYLISLNEDLKSFVTLIKREFSYKLDMETYFENQNIGQYYDPLRRAGFKKLKDLTCKEEKLERKVLHHLKGTEVGLGDKRKLKAICCDKIWEKAQEGKKAMLLQSLQETTPLLSSFFGEVDTIMKKEIQNAQKDMKAIANPGKGKGNGNVVAVRDGLNIVSDLKEKYKSNADSIVKKKALNVITGVEKCCRDMMEQQTQMNQSVKELAKILQAKPEEFTLDDDGKTGILSTMWGALTNMASSSKPVEIEFDFTDDSDDDDEEKEDDTEHKYDGDKLSIKEQLTQKRGAVFTRLKRMCYRDLATGNGGWMTNRDESDTEVPIETYFKGKLQCLVKYLKDADYDEMETLLCDDEDDLEVILEIILEGMAA
eukprot:400476_1